MHGNADGSSLIRERASHGLADPPSRVSRKLVSPPPLELINALHQTDVALLNQVEKLQAAIVIFLSDGDDQAEICFDKFLLGLRGFSFTAKDDLERPL